jgi:AAA domain/Bifunctional DNA primase/polymerase, N-terminal
VSPPPDAEGAVLPAKEAAPTMTTLIESPPRCSIAGGYTGADIVAAANDLTARGLGDALPLHNPTDDEARCSCGGDTDQEGVWHPCPTPGKHPRITGWKAPGYRTKPHEPAAWKRQWPRMNLGLLPAAGLLVMDVDNADTWRSLCAGHDMPKTLTVRTPGRADPDAGHKYFYVPAELTKRKRAFSAAGLDGIDLRYRANGQVVVPPSIHYTGGRYEWVDPAAPIAVMPSGLLDRLRTDIPSTTMAGAAGVDIDSLPAYLLEKLQDPLLTDDGERDRSREIYRICGVCARSDYPLETARALVAADPVLASKTEGRGDDYVRDAYEKVLREVQQERREQRSQRDILDLLPSPERPVSEAASAPTAAPSGSLSAPLTFTPIADLIRQVEARGPRRWLVRRVWPAGAYGVLAAEPKAGKTWKAYDLAVAVASGTPWLGHVPIDTVGPVVIFAGEGGDGNVVRRLRGIAKSRGVCLEALPIEVCARAPHLNNDAHIAALQARVLQLKPVLVILDPLYLSAAGAKGSDLYGMGELLERAQLVCEPHGAALLVVHHHNRNREVNGSRRMSGAGPQEWGRVLISARVIVRRRTPQDGTESVTELDIEGGEVPDTRLVVHRTIRAVDPDDLDSSIEYEITEVEDVDPYGEDDGQDSGDERLDGLSRATQRVFGVLNGEEYPATVVQIAGKVTEKHRLHKPMTRATAQKALGELERKKLASHLDPEVGGRAALWYRIEADDE